jgi:hypothetical protein
MHQQGENRQYQRNHEDQDRGRRERKTAATKRHAYLHVASCPANTGLQQRTTAKAGKSFNCGTKFSIMIRRRPDHDLIFLLSMVFSKL